MIEIEEINGEGWDDLVGDNDTEVKVGVIRDAVHPGSLEIGGENKTIAEVAQFVETGGQFKYLKGNPDFMVGRKHPVKPRPFLKKGVENYIMDDKSNEDIRRVALGDEDGKRNLGEAVKASVNEALHSYDGDFQTTEYKEQYKTSNSQQRLVRTGLLSSSIEYQWD